MYKNILIPILIDEEYDAQTSFSAARVLANEDCKFTILHVLEAIPAYFTAEIPAELLEERRAEISKSLNILAESFPEAETKLMSGHAGSTIVDYADKNEVDCIVVNSHTPGIQDFFLGSTAARVVRHAKCSVHVIR